MRIANTQYYVNATAYFRSAAVAPFVSWGEEGFTYIGHGIAVGLWRTAHSNYAVFAMVDGEVAKPQVFHNVLLAAARCEYIVRTYTEYPHRNDQDQKKI